MNGSVLIESRTTIFIYAQKSKGCLSRRNMSLRKWPLHIIITTWWHPNDIINLIKLQKLITIDFFITLWSKNQMCRPSWVFSSCRGIVVWTNLIMIEAPFARRSSWEFYFIKDLKWPITEPCCFEHLQEFAKWGWQPRKFDKTRKFRLQQFGKQGWHF